jgi:hypothetical protein
MEFKHDWLTTYMFAFNLNIKVIENAHAMVARENCPPKYCKVLGFD